MKKQLLSIFLFLSVTAIAQQFTFQGKIYQNGQPVNGNGNFSFIVINPGNISWTEPHNNVPINNGLYAVVLGSITPLPLDLFKTSNSVEMAVRYNGNWIDTVTLYAPFERDYTVPDSIKDGISWNEVSNKPTLDMSNTNEIQNLSINGNVLSISQGNSVNLPVSGGGNNNVVTGSFTVQDTNVVTLLSTGVSNSTTANVSSAWQSFLATGSGKLRGVRVFLSVNGNSFVTVKVYNGVGNGGQQIGNNVVVSGITGGTQNRILDLSGILPVVSVSYGQLYTVEIIAPVGNTISIGYNNTAVDVYPNGVSNFGIPNDLFFEVFVDNSSPPSFFVGSNGNVGIGTNTPSAQLQVNGRIKDATGFVMPVGSILPYAGNVLSGVPEGWLLCDGNLISRTQYADLFNAIGTAWGTANSSSFNLPDLRGMFLRGVDTSQLGSQNKDPDHGNRVVSNVGGNLGNKVGSLQGDQFSSHNHGIHQPGSPAYNPRFNLTTAGNGGAGDAGSGVIGDTDHVGGNETRPKNAYVNYIIKY